MLRLYFNRRGPVPWSVDDGDQVNEKNFEKVFIANLCGVTRTRELGPGEDPREVPTAWIEFPSGKLILSDGVAAIV